LFFFIFQFFVVLLAWQTAIRELHEEVAKTREKMTSDDRPRVIIRLMLITALIAG